MMRAKLQVTSVVVSNTGPAPSYLQDTVTFIPVCGDKPFGKEGESEDNTYARWTPCGLVTLSITNPNLIGKFKVGQKFYADFTPAE
jgi:hypothetical protein